MWGAESGPAPEPTSMVLRDPVAVLTQQLRDIFFTAQGLGHRVIGSL